MSTDSAKPAKKRLVIKPGMRIADLLILALVGNADNSKKTKIWRCQCLRFGTLKIRKEDIISALAAESGCHPDDLIEFLRAAKIAAKERTYEQN